MNDLEQFGKKVDAMKDELADLRVKLAVTDTRVKVGMTVLGVLIVSPKVGGPSAQYAAEVVLALL